MLRALPAFEDNYIWLLADPDAGTGLVVDPGAAAPVLAALASDGLRLTSILVTHHHHDHIGGIAELVAHFPDLDIVAPADPRIPLATRRVSDSDVVTIPSPAARFSVLAVPGHTRSHLAYHGEGLLFCGDTLFSLGCGRLFEGSPAEMLASLDRLAALPGDTKVCCGHEYTLANAAFAVTVEPNNPALHARIDEASAQRERGMPSLPTPLAQERASNPFLRIDAIAHADSPKRTQLTNNDRVLRFAELRAAKDNFQA